MELGLFLILFLNLGLISTAEWIFEKPDNFICSSNSKTDECPYWRYNAIIQTLYIHFKEGIKDPYTIAYITCTECDKSTEPQISTFLEGNRNILGPELKKENGKYSLVITNELDYEAKNQRKFLFNLVWSGLSEKSAITIELEDIDDNDPTITHAPCVIKENFSGKTDCIFGISDPDTINSVDKITFLIPIQNFTIELKVKDPYNADAILIVPEGKELDFEKIPMYYFQLTAIDGGGNEGTAQILITVQDENDMPPKWITIFAMQSFKEHEEQTFTVLAKDGDLGINEEISYELDCKNFNKYISLEPNGEEAKIIIQAIERDIKEVEDKDNTITCTIIAKDSIFNDTKDINFIIQDINDNKPKIDIHVNNKNIILREQEFITLDKLFSVTDIDQGSNAQFDVMLRNTANAQINYTAPFQIIPTNGYKFWDFSISVIDSKILDYDRTEHWREFSLLIHSKDKGIISQEDEIEIKINLKNLNDEEPIFDDVDYNVEIKESAGKNTFIMNVRALDIDYGDHVEYSLANGGNDYSLDVQNNNDSVTIYTNRDNVFDYEKIQKVFIQVIAQDKLEIPGEVKNLHTVTQQITVTVLDVNDENPRISLPYETKIEEHSKISEVPIEISATDVDTDAELYFSILWNQTRASKLGKPLQDITTIDKVFEIETVYPDDSKRGYAEGKLKIKDKELLDYEEFDTLLLSIRVTDRNQIIQSGIDEGILTISITDINDNPPIFTKESINSKKVVIEHTKMDFKIATIVAKDADGPEFNQITYNLIEINNTKKGLVKIHPKNGDLTVSEDIDADYPDYVQYLYYDVIASDNKFETVESIKIKVDDINDNVPELRNELSNTIIIDERESTDPKVHLGTIEGWDKDRDEPHNLVTYYINNEFTQLSNTYEIDKKTGDIWAYGEIKWTSIEETVRIYVLLEDNFGGQGQANKEKYSFNITINDIDNNAPELPKKINIPKIKENIKIGTSIAEIIATDKDKPCTENTEIKYSIIKLQDKNEVKLPELFELKKKTSSEPKCEQIAEIITKDSLEGHFGTITITIRAENINTPTNYDEENYEIIVEAYNFKPPKIRFPNETTLILREVQTAGDKLIATNNKVIEDFAADDDQGNKFNMIFEKETPWHPDFDFKLPPLVEKNKARLILTVGEPSQKEYSLRFKARHNGEGDTNNFVEQDLKIKFVDADELPFFDDIEHKISFLENQTELSCQSFPPAIDPKCNEDEYCGYITYYHIQNVQEKEYFEVNIDDKKNPLICLKQQLDREQIAYHYLTIYATNDPELHGEIIGYKPLIITVKVEDINDNPPKFTQKLFTGGLADTQKLDSTIIELNATDPDTVDKDALRYEIMRNTIKAEGENLDSVKDKAFKILGNKIQNLFQPTQQMRGYFTFQVKVLDSLDYDDTANVKIDIISDANRVLFNFNEDVDTVKSKQLDIEKIFTEVFKYTCIIDEFEKKENSTTRAESYITEIKTHFTDNTNLINKEVISVKLNDLTIVGRLRFKFEDIDLTLIKIGDGSKESDEDEDMNLKIIFPVVTVVLGTLCITLVIAFILRTRSLNRRLEAMTTNVFGSTKSDLNRIGTSAPGTNRHAIEANPVWNEDLNNDTQCDNISEDSGGSDLIGIEDKPDFAYDYRRASINPVMQQKMYQQNDDINSLSDSNGEQNFSYQNFDNDEISSLPGSRNNSKLF